MSNSNNKFVLKPQPAPKPKRGDNNNTTSSQQRDIHNQLESQNLTLVKKKQGGAAPFVE